MPPAVELRLAIPAELGPEAEVLEELRQRVAAAVASHAAERQRTGQRVYGRRAVLQQSWRAQPTSFELRWNLRPRVAARSQWARIEALRRNRVFLVDYAVARACWQDGEAVTFPIGTLVAAVRERADRGGVTPRGRHRGSERCPRARDLFVAAGSFWSAAPWERADARASCATGSIGAFKRTESWRDRRHSRPVPRTRHGFAAHSQRTSSSGAIATLVGDGR